MKDFSFHIHTIGCKTNLCESDEIARRLMAKGLTPVPAESQPAIIIINSCTVTSAADRKSRQYIRKARALNPDSEIIVTGCGTVFNEKIFENIGAGKIIKNKQKEKIPEIIETGPADAEIKPGATASAFLNANAVKGLPGHNKSKEDFCQHSRALVKIQDGCEQDCSYCIVPLVRGRYKSAPEKEVIEKVRHFVDSGFEEVVFTGIHIGRYGEDILKHDHAALEKPGRSNNVRADLAGLLRKTLENTSIKRIRLSSIEINEIDDDLIEAIKSGGCRVAPHLHIPLQSGSEKILKAMKRKYTCAFFTERIQKLINEIGGIAITTDIITGFPGESEKDFEDTLRALREIGFTKTHVFKYSIRRNTVASQMGGQIDERLKSQRSQKAREAGEKLRDGYISGFINKKLQVVCEAYDGNSSIASGTSGNYLKVYFKMQDKDYSRKNRRIINVKAEKKYLDGLFGNEVP